MPRHDHLIPQDSARRQLIAELQNGEHQCATVADVEALFTGRGVAPGNNSPTPDSFDPQKELGWTLAMAIAWIVWRRLDAVTEQWEVFRATQFEWRYRASRDGPRSWYLEPRYHRPAGTFFELLVAEAEFKDRLLTQEKAFCEHSPQCGVGDGKASLWSRLVTGELLLTACRDGDSRRPVQREEFHDLDVFEDHGEDYLAAGAYAPAYKKPRLLPADVLRLWPPTHEQRKKGAGRKPAYDWDKLKEAAWKKMDHHGDFSNDDREWDGPEKLIKALQVLHGEPCPSRTQLQKHIPEWLAQWREGKSRR